MQRTPRSQVASLEWAVIPPIPPRQIQAILQSLREPTGLAALNTLWSIIKKCHDVAGVIIKRTDWGKVPALELIQILENSLAVSIVESTSVPNQPPLVQRWLYYNGLMNKGVHLKAKDKISPPVLLLFRAEYFNQALEYASAEIVRRSRKHVGFHAAKLLWLMAYSVRDQKDADSALLSLRKAAWGQIPARLRAAAVHDLSQQIPVTLHNKWGSLEPRQVLARSLEGKLNIAPRAIRDAFVKDARREKKRQEFEVLFDPQELSHVEIQFSTENPENIISSNELYEMLRSDVTARRILVSRLDGVKTQAEIAKEWGVTTRTIKNWLSNAKTKLQG